MVPRRGSLSEEIALSGVPENCDAAVGSFFRDITNKLVEGQW